MLFWNKYNFHFAVCLGFICVSIAILQQHKQIETITAMVGKIDISVQDLLKMSPKELSEIPVGSTKI